MQNGTTTDISQDEEFQEFSEFHDNPGHLIRRCHQIAVGLFWEEFGEFGVTPIQSSILVVLRKRPGLDQTTLGGLVALDRTNTATTLARLEQKGLVERRPSSSDRRVKQVYLTEAGKQLLDKMPSFGQAVSGKMLDELSPAERYLFIDILKKIVRSKNACSRAPLQADRAPAGSAE